MINKETSPQEQPSAIKRGFGITKNVIGEYGNVVRESLFEATGRRKIFVSIMERVLLADVIQNPEVDGIGKFVKKLEEGMGGVVIIRHFANTDPFVVTDVINQNEVIQERRLSSVIQKDINKWGFLEWFAKQGGIDLFPIVNENTTKSKIATGETTSLTAAKRILRLNTKNETFAKAIESIKNGSISIFAPEAVRSPRLEMYKGRSVGRFIEAANEAGIDDIPFLFIGLREKGTDGNYDKKRNFVRHYEVLEGDMRMGSEMVATAGGTRFVDEVVVFPEMVKTAAIGNPKK